MPRKKADVHYIYKTVCLITGRYYIGMHSTANINDGYMGSGKRLRHSIRKYGKENHVREILEYCDTRELLIEKEKEIISFELICDELCMNLKEGGAGGLCNEFHYKAFTDAGINNFNKTREIRDKKILEIRTNPDTLKAYGKKVSDGLKKFYETNDSYWKGKNLSKETKDKIGLANSIKQSGSLNSQFGTCWITNGEVNKKIKKENLTEYLANGWISGRIKL